MPDLLQHLSPALADRYRIERELGRGGMATVFLAEDLKHHRQVAIKVLDPEVAAAIGPERFLREIETVARLAHPHILALHDSGQADSLLYFVMPYIEGGSLRSRLERERQLPLEDALRVTAELADALDYAHEHGIVHRDLKPENVMLQHGRALLADFGVARAVEAAGGARLTRTGFTVGTPPYMSPEQIAGGAVDARSDVYGLACVAYEMLAGQAPFTGPTVESVTYQHLSAPPPEVTRLRPGVGAAVATALQRALAKAPADRFASTGEFAAALAGQLTSGSASPAAELRAAEFARAIVMTAPAPTPAPPAPVPRRRWLVPATVALAVLATIVTLAKWQGWWPFEPPGPAVGGSRERVLVADFVGPAGDASLARTAREIVVAAIDQSPVLITLSPEQVREALRTAGLPDTLALTPRRARELAYRATVRTLLEGEVSRLGTSYALTLRASDVEGDRTLVTLTGTARSENDLIPALNALARKLRGRLGERPELLGTPRGDERWNVATPSFEAYRLWAEGVRLATAGDQQGALWQYRAALALDPGFGAAWVEAGFCYANLGRRDSAVLMGEEALRHPASLSPATRLIAQGWLQAWRGDLPGAIQVYERVRRLHPGSKEAEMTINNETFALMAEGRSAEALAVIDAPDAPGLAKESEGLVIFRIILLCDLGRTAEARSLLDRITPAGRPWFALGIAVAAGEWARADSIAGNLLATSGSNSGQARAARGMLTNIGAVRGQVAAAAESLRSRGAIRGPVLLALAWGLDLPRLPAGFARDTSATALISNAYVAAASGDSVTARRLVALLRATSSGRYGAHGNTPEFLEAVVAARAGRWPDVIRLVAEPARLGRDRGNNRLDRIGPQHERWLVAYAYERMQMPDSAAAFYRRLLGPDWGGAPMLWSLAHARLAVLAARAGKAGEAARHLAILERECTRPDAFAQRQLDQARAAVMSLRGMARPEASRP